MVYYNAAVVVCNIVDQFVGKAEDQLVGHMVASYGACWMDYFEDHTVNSHMVDSMVDCIVDNTVACRNTYYTDRKVVHHLVCCTDAVHRAHNLVWSKDTVRMACNVGQKYTLIYRTVCSTPQTVSDD